MKNHTKVYLRHFGHAAHEDTWILCEVCGSRAQDIHHLSPRGMGGSKQKDYIENLMALCRKCHIDAEAHRLPEDYLRITHLDFLHAQSRY